MIRPGHADHQAIQSDVETVLRASGFMVASATYHDVMPPEIVTRMSHLNVPTTLRLRTRADRVAVHESLPVAFEFECKSNASARHRNMCVEAVPLFFHMIEADVGVRCLYAYRDPFWIGEPRDFGFWVGRRTLPKISRVVIPSRWSPRGVAWFRAIADRLAPGSDVSEVGTVAGSGDPFAIIQERDVAALPDWADLIAGLVRSSNPDMDPRAAGETAVE